MELVGSMRSIKALLFLNTVTILLSLLFSPSSSLHILIYLLDLLGNICFARFLLISSTIWSASVQISAFLSRIGKLSERYLVFTVIECSRFNLWISDYFYLRYYSCRANYSGVGEVQMQGGPAATRVNFFMWPGGTTYKVFMF